MVIRIAAWLKPPTGKTGGVGCAIGRRRRRPSTRARTASALRETGWCFAKACGRPGMVRTGTNDDDANTRGASTGEGRGLGGLRIADRTRVGHQRRGDVQAPARAAGVRSSGAVTGLREVEPFHELCRSGPDTRAPDVGEAPDQAQVHRPERDRGRRPDLTPANNRAVTAPARRGFSTEGGHVTGNGRYPIDASTSGARVRQGGRPSRRPRSRLGPVLGPPESTTAPPVTSLLECGDCQYGSSRPDGGAPVHRRRSPRARLLTIQHEPGFADGGAVAGRGPGEPGGERSRATTEAPGAAPSPASVVEPELLPLFRGAERP